MTPTYDQIRAAERAVRELRLRVDENPARALTYDPTRDQLAERAARAAAELADGEYRPAYNGWTNRETWSASLWINNEEPTYRQARAIVRSAFRDYEEPELLAQARADDPPEQRAADRRRGAIRTAADELRDWYEELYAPTDTASPLADAWTYAVAVVDWYRIAEGHADELREEIAADAAADAENVDEDEESIPNV